MDLTAQQLPDTLLVTVGDSRIDATVAIRFKDLMREIADGTDGRVVLDLSKVQFIDSSGLGALVSVMKILAPHRKLELAAVTPTVERVLHLTRMNSVMTIHTSVPLADDRTQHSDAGV